MGFCLLASLTDTVSFIGYVLLAILMLLVMITVHELGHYISGKIFHFGIEEFSIGFGPKLYSRIKKDGERFSIRLFPFGGFCGFIGEDGSSDNPQAFNNKKPWQRLIVLFSGVIMNYLFAVTIIAVMFGIYGETALMTYKMQENAAATYTAENSFIDKDVIIKIDGKNVYMITDLISITSGKKAGESINATVLRNGKQTNISVLLRADADYENIEDTKTVLDVFGIYYIADGITGEISQAGIYQTGVRFGFFKLIGHSFEYSVKIAATIFAVIGELITGLLSIKALGGTVTTVSVTAAAIKVGGLRNLLSIASFIGVNLAVFNALPIPALDGSRAVFTVIEWVSGKPVNRKAEAVIHTVGFILLVAFAVFIDLQQCF